MTLNSVGDRLIATLLNDAVMAASANSGAGRKFVNPLEWGSLDRPLFYSPPYNQENGGLV